MELFNDGNVIEEDGMTKPNQDSSLPDSDRPAEEEPTTFESSFAKIESIVRRLEQGTSGLDESLAMYQSAVMHMRFCHRKLEEAQRRVQILQGVADDGSFEAQDFDDSASTLSEKAASRSTRRSASSEKRSKSQKDLLP